MKTLILSIAMLAFAPFANAYNRCQKEATEAVTAKAKMDYPNIEFTVTFPDYQDGDLGAVETYVADLDLDGHAVARYAMLVDETCAVIAPPTLIEVHVK